MFNSIFSRITSSIPSIPFLSISATLQRNILSFLLKRTLGHLLKGGQLDSTQIEAGIAGGRIELRGVELDTQALKSHLPASIPIDFTSGVIGTISIQLPFPNFWSGDLDVKVSDLDLCLCLEEADSTGKESETQAASGGKEEGITDLESSLISAADEALKNDEEGQELENSIINETTASDPNPSSSSKLPVEEEKITIISSIVESLLQRLKIQVADLRIRVVNQTQVNQVTTPQALEVKVKQIVFDTKSSSSGTENLGHEPVSTQETFRNLRVSGFSLWISSSSQSASNGVRERENRHIDRKSTTNRSRSSSDSSSNSKSDSNSDGEGNSNYLAMSSAIQDLRESRAGLDVFQSMRESMQSDSMYHSAVELKEQGGEEIEKQDEGASENRWSTNEASSSPHGENDFISQESQSVTENQDMFLFLALAEEDPLTIKLKTTKYIIPPSNQTTTLKDPISPTSPQDTNLTSHDSTINAQGVDTSKKPKETNLSISVPTISIFLDCYQVSALLSFGNFFFSSLASSASQHRDPSKVKPSVKNVKTKAKPFEVSLKVKSIQTILIYDIHASPRQLENERFNFFQGSDPFKPKIGHLKIRVQMIRSNYSTDGNTRSSNIEIEDVGVFECLDSKLIQYLEKDRLKSNAENSKNEQTQNRRIHSTLPLVLFDEDLVPNESSSGVESLDWRFDDSSNPNSLAYQSYDSREQGWKVKPRSPKRSDSQDMTGKHYLKQVSDANSIVVRIKFKDFDEIDDDDENAGTIESVTIELKPVHIFIDPSAIKRVLPSLTKATSHFTDFDQGDRSTPKESTKDALGQDPVVDLSSSVSTILGGNDLKSKKERKFQERTPKKVPDDSHSSSPQVSLSSALMRIEVRIPSKPSKGATSASPSGDLVDNVIEHLGLRTRSGILLLDLTRLNLNLGSKGSERLDRTAYGASSGVKFGQDRPSGSTIRSDGTEIFSVEVQELYSYLKPDGSDRAERIAVAEEIAPGEESSSGSASTSSNPKEKDGSDSHEKPLSPRFSVKRKASNHLVTQMSSFSIPSIRVYLCKVTLDSLFFAIDDLSAFAGSFNQDLKTWKEDDKGNLIEILTPQCNVMEEQVDEIKAFGSRILGNALKDSVLSYDSDKTEKIDNEPDVDDLELEVEEINLWFKLQDHQSKKDSAHGIEIPSKSLRLEGKELNVNSNSRKKDSRSKRSASNDSMDSTSISVSLSSLSIQEVLGLMDRDQLNGRGILDRNFKPSLTNRNVPPMISVQFTSLIDANNSYRESRLELGLRSFTLFLTGDFGLASEVQKFLKSPEGTFENVEPNELTRISLKLKDGSVHLRPPNVPSRAALVIGKSLIRAKITTESPKTPIHYACADVALFVTDREELDNEWFVRTIPRSGQEHWTSRGFARLLNLNESKGSIVLSPLTRPDLDVKILRADLKLMACADTLSPIEELIKDLLEVTSSNKSRKRADSGDSSTSDLRDSSISSNLDDRDPMVISFQENAFPRPSSSIASSVPDLMEDDIPSNPAFLGTSTEPEVIETPLDSSEFFGDDESVTSISTAARSSGHNNIMLATESVTVRLLDPSGIRPKSLYFADPDSRRRPIGASDSAPGKIRIRCSNCDVSLGLYAGYDWKPTRQAIEEEARKVRRRLQKIKQLVAEGQKPDDSVKEATGNLFESIHISLPHDTREMGAADVINVLDEEIDGDQSETASSASTWQQPLLHPHGSTPSSSTGQKKKKSKLQRSTSTMIDIELKGSEFELDSFDELHPISSRIVFSASTLEVIDNLKTSTWRTFLTSMPPEGPAYRRDADAKMVKVEIKEIRPERGSPRTETRMRAKIEPLRLHVDQDALDFLKKFFAFKAPGTPIPTSTPRKETSPFIQHAEIFPIRLKLDYKPKRVDYNLLREGKTIELMNFFHFEGAEMTLRHVTLRGITGWTRLFDTLNDIWTPDIKANQLADVLSGVAPIRSLVNVGAGVADLVLLPLEQYQKDGRLLRGVQKGANSFAKNTMLEAVKLGARLATGTQVVLEKAEHVLGGRISDPVQAEALGLTSSPVLLGELSSRRGRKTSDGFDEDDGDEDSKSVDFDADSRKKVISKYADQPEDMTEALNQAYKGLSKGLSSAAQTILAVPMEVYERGGGEGGTHPVVRAVPIAVLRGAMGASEAVSKTLMGVRNSLDPNAQTENDGKYKHRDR